MTNSPGTFKEVALPYFNLLFCIGTLHGNREGETQEGDKKKREWQEREREVGECGEHGRWMIVVGRKETREIERRGRWEEYV